MYADYVNILTTVKNTVNVNDPPLEGVIPMPAGCVDPTFNKARLYNTQRCPSGEKKVDNCSLNICCNDNCWGWFYGLNSNFGKIESDLSMIPEC